MKAHWFTALSVVGLVLLMGHSFGGELRWKKPSENCEPEDSSVLRIPSVISTDDEAILQVQALEPIQLPPSVIQFDRTWEQNPPSGATTGPQNQIAQPNSTLRNTPPLPARTTTSEKRSVHQCDGKITLKTIREISHDIRPSQTSALPEECVVDSNPYYGRHFGPSCVQWTASAVSTKAAYFEDVQLERYGHSRCPRLQPVISGARFFATIPLVPIKMGITPASECVYTLGHYRTGNWSPYMVEPCLTYPR